RSQTSINDSMYAYSGANTLYRKQFLIDVGGFRQNRATENISIAWDHQMVGAVPRFAPNIVFHMNVQNRTSLLGKSQTVEFSSIVGVIKRSQTSINDSMYAYSGANTLYRKQFLIDVGGFRQNRATEDISIAWDHQMVGAVPRFAPNIVFHMNVQNRTSLLGKSQTVEFSSIVGVIKRSQTSINDSMYAYSGANTLYRKQFLIDVGGFRQNRATEDISIAWDHQMVGARRPPLFNGCSPSIHGYEPLKLRKTRARPTPSILACTLPRVSIFSATTLIRFQKRTP
ncbi:hypothetical protein WP50_31210, partial [Lactiplantibacillus plantarum]